MLNSGKEIIIPIQINGRGRYNDVFIDENQIKSVYGRNNLDKYLNDNNFIEIYKKEDVDFNEGIQYSNVATTSNITNSVPQKSNTVIILICMYLEGKGTYNNLRVDTNKVKTVYGKNDIKNLVDRTIIEDTNNLIYLTRDKNKRNLITSLGLQLSNSSIRVSNNSVPQKSNTVNNINMQNLQNNALLSKNNNVLPKYSIAGKKGMEIRL